MTATFHVGFSGSSEYIPAPQHKGIEAVFKELMAANEGSFIVLHHGDCRGGDADAHMIAKLLGWRVEIHPPINPRKRALCADADLVHEPRDYLVRNGIIAARCNVLVAALDEPQEVVRSGTWSTVRYARKLGRRVLIVQPNGFVVEDGAR